MENKDNKSLLEVAIEIQKTAKDKTTFLDLYKKVSTALKLTEDEKKQHIAQFYTDITSCGDFVYCGEDLWDLKENLETSALESEFYQEHMAEEETEEEIEEKKERARKAKARKKQAETVEDIVDEEQMDDYSDSEDEEYENEADFDEDESDDDYDSYEKDVDSDLDEDDDKDNYDDDDQDQDEDEYNKIMDDYEDLYEN